MVEDELVSRFERRRADVLATEDAARVALPGRLARQHAHFTTPASDRDRIAKAAAGLGGVVRLLERLELRLEDVASAVGVEPALLAELVDRRPAAPLVIVDGEDATAPDPAVIARARATAASALVELAWGETALFYRPNGLDRPECARDLVEVVSAAARAPGGCRLDGVVWPKATSEDEVHLVADLLARLEREHGLAPGQLRLMLLVESAQGVQRVGRLVQAAGRRLCALILGIADLCADVGLPEVRQDHPLCDAARIQLVLAGAAVGVPAIDSMTFEYPVRDPALDGPANRARLLGALATCARDARRALSLGLQGKWVGHPLQLLVVEAVTRASVDPRGVERDVALVRAYAAAVAKGEGAVMIGGAMSDRATDRHARTRLRRALSLGALEPAIARELALTS